MHSLRILVLGAGAVGGYFGGRLIEAGADVTFLVRPNRANQLARDGLVIDSPLGNLRRAVKTVQAGARGNRFDLAILTCKAYDLDATLRDIEAFVAETTEILPLLNGIAHLEVLNRAFGARHVLGGCCHIGVSLLPSGNIRHLNDLHELTFGALPGTRSIHLGAFAEIATAANLAAHESSNILQDLWNKFVMLATLAGATCLMRAPIGTIMNCDDGRAIVMAMLDECVLVAEAAGYGPETQFLARARSELTRPDSTSTASMLRDIRIGAATEARHILGDMAERAVHAGLDTPYLRIANCHLQAYEIERRKAANQ